MDGYLVAVRKGQPGDFAMIGKVFPVKGSAYPDLFPDGTKIWFHQGQASGEYGHSVRNSLRGLDLEAVHGEVAKGVKFLVHWDKKARILSLARLEDFLNANRCYVFAFNGRTRVIPTDEYWVHLLHFKTLPFHEAKVPKDQVVRYPKKRAAA